MVALSARTRFGEVHRGMVAGDPEPAPRRVTGRDRSQEPLEQRRAELRRAGKCIACEQPSRTQRCPTCRAAVEANTKRYRGREPGRRGALTAAEADAGDLRQALESLGRAHRDVLQLVDAPNLPTFDRRLVMLEAVSQVSLGVRFATEVLIRHGAAKCPSEPFAPDDGGGLDESAPRCSTVVRRSGERCALHDGHDGRHATRPPDPADEDEP